MDNRQGDGTSSPLGVPGSGGARHGLAGLEVHVRYPGWVASLDWEMRAETDADKMALAIEVSRLNVELATGGPFGSAIFERDTGALVAIGMNLVVPSHNSTLHGEMVAFQMAQARLRSHTLGGPGMRPLELFTSCEPCAMCLGATLWSGVSRVVTAATGDDARAIGFDEGPVFAESWRYLEERGLLVAKNVLRFEAKAVLDDYAGRGGHIYNGASQSWT